MPPVIAPPGQKPLAGSLSLPDPGPRHLTSQHAQAANAPCMEAPAPLDAGPVDWLRLAARYRAHPGLMAKLARTVVNSFGPKPARLRAAWATGDRAGLTALAHELKGALGGLMADTALAQRLERGLRDGHDSLDDARAGSDFADDQASAGRLADWVEALACATEAVVVSAQAQLPAEQA